jgi:hypothetical protein
MASPMLSAMHKTRASLVAERTQRAQGAARAAGGFFAAALHGIVLSACPDRAVACTAYVDVTQIRQLRKD